MRDPLSVAKSVLLGVIERLEWSSACDFCEAGECDEYGGEKLHSEECPLYGFDMTKDVEDLKKWAKT